jgi:hypothetical protein
MTLGNMRALGVQRLIASRLNHACRHTALLVGWHGDDPGSILPEWRKTVNQPSSHCPTRSGVIGEWKLSGPMAFHPKGESE